MLVKEMIKSQNDKRLYRVIQLDNGLRAILVSSINSTSSGASANDSEDDWDASSDETSIASADIDDDSTSEDGSQAGMKEKMSAAALAVHCGSFHDPPHVPGLAHYLEHMLFMGSEKYPEENVYTDFLTKHGGSDNAYTEFDATVFYFDVSMPAFAKTLDMFANFFISPLLRESSLEREVEAVESEFQLQQVRDECRVLEVLARQAGPDHPMGKFVWGNRKTLKDRPKERGLIMRNELLEFMKNYYSADKMTLCVQSKHTLDELEAFVRESFSAIPKHDTKKFKFPDGLPFLDNPDFFKLYKVVPMKHDKSLRFYWPLPPQRSLYREKNLAYLGYVIGHEARHSILDYLREKQWAIELEAGCDEDSFNANEMYSMFELSLTLTDEGARHIGEVTRYVHQYIHMVRKKGPQEWLWNELKGIAETDFRFEEESSAQAYVTDLCVAMQDLPPEHYLCGYELYFDYNPQRLQTLMDLLTPERCCILHVDTDFQKETNLFPLKEPFMGVPYKIEEFSDQWRKWWIDDPEFQRRFELPEPNTYIPQNFELVSDLDYAQKECPVILEKGKRSKLWFRKDETFRVPKLQINAHLVSDVVHRDVTCDTCVDVALNIFEQVLAPILNYAEMASLDSDICDSPSGLVLMFSGFSDKLPLLFETITDRFVSLQFSEEQFRTIMEDLRKIYYNALYCVKYADEIANILLRKKYSAIADRRARLDSLTKQDVEQMLSSTCRSAFLEMYVHGNATADQAKQLMHLMEAKLDAAPTRETLYRSIAKIEGSHYLRFLALNPKEENSRIINYYQYGDAHLYESTMSQVVELLLGEKCFNELRTIQQMGYDVSFRSMDFSGIIGFSVTVSPLASKFSLTHVDEKIDEFMDKMSTFIENLSDSEFETACQAVIKVKSCVDLSMDDEQNRHWVQIQRFDYCFDILQLEVEFLKKLTRAQFVGWCRKLFHPEGGVRKVSIQLVGYGEKALKDCVGGDEIWQKHLDSAKQKQDENVEISPMTILLPKDTKGKTFITDLEVFKSSLDYFECHRRDPHTPFKF